MSKVVYLHLQNLCQIVIINKIKWLVWVALLCLVSIVVQAQNSTHQSINDVLKPGPIRLQIQCRKFFWGKWHDDVIGYIYPDNGEIGIDISGYVGLGGKTSYIDEKSKTLLLTY